MAPILVVGDEFCVPSQTDLVLKKKLKSLFASTSAEVFDTKGNLMFQIFDNGGFHKHENRYMRSAGGFPIMLISNKIMSCHDRWMAYRGDTHTKDNLLFTVKRSHVFQLKIELDVFLATNADESICDFKVKSNFSNHSIKMYKGDSIIAEINHKFTWGDFFVGKDAFNVRIYPEVDYAFIISLLIILCEIVSASGQTSVG